MLSVLCSGVSTRRVMCSLCLKGYNWAYPRPLIFISSATFTLMLRPHDGWPVHLCVAGTAGGNVIL